MFQAIGRALAQMFSRRFFGVLLSGMALTLVLYGLLFWGLQWGLDQMPEFRWGWADGVITFLSSLGFIVLMALLFPVVTSLFIGFFLDQIADAVEARYYPDELADREQSLLEALGTAIKFAFVILGVNLIALPFYFVPGLGILLYVLVNGYLLGREYFELVAFRHFPPKEVNQIRRRQFFYVLMAGIVIAIPMSIPVINLVAPLFGTAFMVHIVKKIEHA